MFGPALGQMGVPTTGAGFGAAPGVGFGVPGFGVAPGFGAAPGFGGLPAGATPGLQTAAMAQWMAAQAMQPAMQ